MLAVDQVVTISLIHRDDRRELVNRELSKLALKTDFYLAQADSENRERGCFNSHRAVCADAMRAGLNNILVFEDDVKIRHFTTNQIARINHFVKQQAHRFDILYLGLIIGDMWFSPYRSIVRTRGAGAHAYIVSQRGMKKLAQYDYQGIPIDKIMKRELKCYSIYPMIAEQHPETVVTSDISSDRQMAPLKDERFWQNNYAKQNYLPWKNLHKSIIECVMSF